MWKLLTISLYKNVDIASGKWMGNLNQGTQISVRDNREFEKAKSTVHNKIAVLSPSQNNYKMSKELYKYFFLCFFLDVRFYLLFNQ